MASTFVNEAIQPYINKDLASASTRIKYSLTAHGDNYVLRFEKRLEGGFSDGLPIQFVRLFIEKPGTVTVRCVKVYRYGIGFKKYNDINNNIIKFPFSVNIEDNGYLDVPVNVQDEIFEIELDIPGHKGFIYASLNGADDNLVYDAIKQLKEDLKKQQAV